MVEKLKIAKARKQATMIEKCVDKRQELKAVGDCIALTRLPRDSNPNRLRLHDQMDGHLRGYTRKFGMSRIKPGKPDYQGLVPGVRKASW